MANTSSVHVTHTEVIELDKQEEAVYQYLKRRGKILDKRVLDNTKIKIMSDSINLNSLSNSQSPDKINKSILSTKTKNSLSTTKKNDLNNSILQERNSLSQPSSPLMDKYQKSLCTSVNNTPQNKSIVSMNQKNSVFKDESLDFKSRISSVDNSPLMKRLSEFSVASISSSSRNSQYKSSKGNAKDQMVDKQRSKFKISSTKQIKLDKNSIGLIQHFKNISNKPNEQYFFLVTVSRGQIEEYLNLRYPEYITQKILTFMECPQEMNFRQYRKWIERFNTWSLSDVLFFCFYIFDFNQDGLICQTDVFDIIRNKQTQMLEKDFTQISRYVAIKIKYTKNVENLIDQPLFPDLYKQKNLSYMTYRKIAENEDFGERERFQKKIKEHKEMGINLTLFSIWDQYKEKFLEQKDIEEEIKIQETFEETEKKKIKEIMSMGKGDCVRYFKSDKKFKLNFNQFKSIFIREKPFFFYDLLACLGLYQQSDVQYPYSIESEFTKQCNQLIKIRSNREQEEKQIALNNQMTAEKLNKLQVQKILKFYKDHGGTVGAKSALEKMEIVPQINM